MPSFQKGPNYKAPFGSNNYLRSTQDVKTTSYTFASDGIPAVAVAGSDAPQKVLQKGTLVAKITSGDDAGKVGVYLPQATDGRQTAANIVGFSNTFLPWTLLERDVEIAVAYEASVVEAWCFEWADDGVYNGGAYDGVADGTFVQIALRSTTVTAIAGVSGVRFLFK